MYYICKFSESWSIYDGKKNNSRPLEKTEIDCLKNLFPALLNDSGKILIAVQVTEIQPNKLMKISGPEKKEPPKKILEASKTSIP
jgi:hypothetical protein